MNIQTEQNLTETNVEFNFKEMFFKYLSKWPLFVLGVIVALSIAFIYLRYSVNYYSASAVILVKDDKKGGIASELAALSEMDMLGKVKNTVDNEIEVVRSRTIAEYAVRDLELDIRYISEGTVKKQDLYKSSPIRIVFNDKNNIKKNVQYKVTSHKGDKYTLYDRDDKALGTYKFGEVVKSSEGGFTIINQSTNQNGFTVTIMADPILKVAQSFKNRMNVAVVSENTSVVQLSIVDPIRARAEDFLNAVIANYNKDAVNDKNQIFMKTSEFIEERLKLISGELGDVEKEGEAYKKSNKVTDIVSEAGLFLQDASLAKKEYEATETQISVVESLRDNVKKAAKTELIPANMLTTTTLDANTVPMLIGEYNTLLLNLAKFTSGAAGPENRKIVQMESQAASLKQNIISSLDRLKSTLEIKRRDLLQQQRSLSGQISEVPTQEREYKSIVRQQSLKEALYIYLLEKREETAISLASTAPNAKIIDPALASDNPVSPKRNVIYLIALALGLFIPFAYVYIKDLLDTKIHGFKEIQKLSVPFLGDVPRFTTGNNELVNAHSRSSTAESLRIIRTNLEFILSKVDKDKCKT
ncbi:GumC family protein, partial [Flavobacterium sp.]